MLLSFDDLPDQLVAGNQDNPPAGGALQTGIHAGFKDFPRLPTASMFLLKTQYLPEFMHLISTFFLNYNNYSIALGLILKGDRPLSENY